MKKYVVPLITLFSLLLIFSVTSCSKDGNKDEEEDQSYDESVLVGKWVQTHSIYEDEEGEYDDNKYKVSEEADVIEFMADGSCNNYSYVQSIHEFDWDDQGDWNLRGNRLSLLYECQGQRTVKVTQLTSSILSFEDEGIDDGIKYKFTMTYQKVSSSSGKPDNPNNPDNPDPDDPDDPDDPWVPEEPDTPQLPSNVIESKIRSVYEDRIFVDFTYDKSYYSDIKQSGHCWGTSPHPTILDSSVRNSFDQYNNTGSVQCDLKGAPGTTYYIRAYVQVGSKFIYFNEMKVQSVGGDIKLSVYYSKEKDKIAVDYDINKSGTFELCFFARLTRTDNNVVDSSLGFITKGKAQKFVTNYSCYYYYAYLIEASTGIIYNSNMVNKY